MYAFKQLKKNKKLYNKLDKTFPFIEIYCDPLRDYQISWFYPHALSKDEKALISRYFDNPAGQFIEEKDIEKMLPFMEEAAEYDTIRIRPEVREKIERVYEELMLTDLRKKAAPDFSGIKAELFPYQKEGISFALFRRAAIIADEMGLGKTLQAIGTAALKKAVLGFRKTLVVCPATLKSQWKKEIEKFTAEQALVISGLPKEREKQYQQEGLFFFIINYETVLRDWPAINRAGFDLLILDEAQKIKNYETKTASAVKRLKTRHSLVITGTPIENRLIDIYSIINTIDPLYLGPLWEFSYKYCLFDPERPNKINGYYNLQELNRCLSGILIRREKREVLNQLPFVQQRDVPVDMSPLQQELHAGFMLGIAKIIQKKFLTSYDIQRLNMLLNNARMVCDSTFLIDRKTGDSPKLIELEEILFEKLDIKNNVRKVIVFSEWIKMHSLIGRMLRKRGVGFTELNGTVPVKARGELIRQFETDPDCRVFLSTEAGGAGLNLQAADILINFELPWNPAKKNQRIGRIDRLGQKSSKLTIYNLISRNSIEQQIAAGLLVKQSLFEGALSKGGANYVDFSAKGRSQFIQQLAELVKGPEPETSPEPAAVLPVAAGEFQAEQLEEILNKGMDFLAVLFRMSTGTDLAFGNQKISVDKASGEVSLQFNMIGGKK
jgi:SNF2 family DNA or RNA helicase